MKTSLFEIFKVGIGPSSSHTTGPMRAAAAFVALLGARGLIARVRRVEVELYGSLALTGRGHGTAGAILLGLTGAAPDQLEPASIAPQLAQIRAGGSLRLAGTREIAFDESRDVLFLEGQVLPGHSNAMRFHAWDGAGAELAAEVYYSIGGGFIARKGEEHSAESQRQVPYPFSSAAELLRAGDENRLAIHEIVFENEKSWRGEDEVRARLRWIWDVMRECVARGLSTGGVLPGKLGVRRRAPALAARLLEQGGLDPLAPLDWINAFALAVGEENAAGGRVVTAPTNGAAGIIPAVAHYYMRFVPGATEEGLFRFLLTAGAIGILYKENASISGAEVGCQGEIGVACSMAAGGLAAALGGNNRQVEYAAEMAMEHNLGMTCDPIAGLVQIPCIERNAMGAVKAVNACRIAIQESGEHKVSLDQVIETMYRTGLDMQSRYKETSLAGLALNLIKC
ncbi:MAG TPA: L-serine ammonia-lyase [Bryobacteraceae bacterium]